MYITTNTWSAIKRPEAFITKGKKRIKQFDGKVYLSNGDEYEIELFNSTQEVVLAKIKIDGDYIAGGGIVLRRGERVFLERFLDSPKRFKFSTYEVSKNNLDAQEAIANNGYVEIEFYSEYKPTTINTYPHLSGGLGTGWTTISTNSSPITYTANSGNFTLTGTTTTSNAFYSAGPGDISVSGDLFIKGQSVSKALGLDRKMETGVTEKGGDSSQTFSYSNKTFNSYSFYNVVWQILPNTQKQYTSDELNVNYCGNCGAKRKKSSFKFCPHCGTQF